MLFLIVFCLIPITSAELVFVTVAHRHGDRTPLHIYPTDPYQESHWKIGLGKLTNVGKNQLYELGKFMRHRYSGFLPLEYHDDDVHVESSEESRSILSAYSALASLYEDDNSTLSFKNWQPVPVYTLPRSSDNKIVNKAPCPKYIKLMENIFENELSAERKQKYGKVLKNLSYFTDLNLKPNLHGANLTVYIFDALFVEDSHNLTLPDWTADFYFEPLYEISKLALYEVPYYNNELKRFRCGPILKEIIENFEKKINGSMTMKWWQYSGHDRTVAHVLSCLNVFDGEVPRYGSAVFLELHKKSEKEYRVAVVYRKSKDDLQNLIVPGCELYCPLEKLKELVKDVIPENWKEECKLDADLEDKRDWKYVRSSANSVLPYSSYGIIFFISLRNIFKPFFS